jgi:hypothetical protein
MLLFLGIAWSVGCLLPLLVPAACCCLLHVAVATYTCCLSATRETKLHARCVVIQPEIQHHSSISSTAVLLLLLSSQHTLLLCCCAMQVGPVRTGSEPQPDSSAEQTAAPITPGLFVTSSVSQGDVLAAVPLQLTVPLRPSKLRVSFGTT